jgi:hypothetical protein
MSDASTAETVAEVPDVPVDQKSTVVSLIPPVRFGHVNPGVTRGAYPTLRNFRFLSRLQLKTIVSLTPEPPIADLVLFAEMAGIKLVHFPIGRMAGLSEAVQSTITSAVNVSPPSPFQKPFAHNLLLLALLLRCIDMHRGEEPPGVRSLPGRTEDHLPRRAVAPPGAGMDAAGHPVRILAVSTLFFCLHSYICTMVVID